MSQIVTLKNTQHPELSDDELYLYSRQILLDAWDLDAQQRLKNSHVLLIGAGGLGCLCAEILARAGVGHITILDYDRIEISNLQRQVAFSSQQVGRFKAECLAERLSQINPHIQVQAYNHAFDISQGLASVEAYVQQCDLVLDGSDRFKTRYAVNQACKFYGVPLLSASAIALQGQLLWVDSRDAQAACYACLFPADDDWSDEEQGRCATSGVLASTPNVMASLQAHHALLYLGLGEMPLKSKLLLWNGRDFTQRIVAFSQDEHCAVCHATQAKNQE
ncbi:MAG: HesA/MoeB/ThiF family protein [Acinetobacter sp.]|nr:HesA/MoeB/ThiF family protein [Acinetobacter sp.]